MLNAGSLLYIINLGKHYLRWMLTTYNIWASPLGSKASENIDRHTNDSEMTWILTIIEWCLINNYICVYVCSMPTSLPGM